MIPTPNEIAQAVWQYVSRTLTNNPQIAQAVLDAAQATPIHANVQQINDAEVIGAGTENNRWRGVGVSP